MSKIQHLLSKSSLRTLHRVVGLALCLFVILQAASGAALANREALLPVIHPWMEVDARRTPIGLDALVAAARAARPDRTLERLWYEEQPGLAVVARFYDRDGHDLWLAFLDPFSGKILSAGPVWKYPVYLAEAWHMSMLSGKSAVWNLAAASAGLALALSLLLMIASGWSVWWPGVGRLASALRIRWRSPAQTRDLHVSTAVMLSPFLLATASTAALILADPVFQGFADLASGAKLQASSVAGRFTAAAPADETMRLDWADGLAAAQRRFPQADLMQIRPMPGDRSFVAMFYAHGGTNPRGSDIALVDRISGRVTALKDSRSETRRQALRSWSSAIHSGAVLQAFRTPVMTALCVGVIALAITGPYYWWSKRRRRRTGRPHPTA